jgi:uncharacterized ferritin-like protein (DUF455 family)
VPDWSPFDVLPPGTRAPMRALGSPEGVQDRLRAIAFAEQQARDAFRWAAQTFEDAPEPLRRAWRGLAEAEEKHRQWLLGRLAELGGAPDGRPVSADLWRSLVAAESAEAFARLMAASEQRGQDAGERMAQRLANRDPVTADLLARIAEEEATHVALAARFFPDGG